MIVDENLMLRWLSDQMFLIIKLKGNLASNLADSVTTSDFYGEKTSH